MDTSGIDAGKLLEEMKEIAGGIAPVQVSWVSIVAGFIIFILGVAVWIVLGRMSRREQLQKIAQKRGLTAQQRHVTRMLLVVLRWVVLYFTIIFTLGAFGVDVGAIVAMSCIAAVAALYLAKDSLSDILLGIRVITDGFFKVGDVVESEGIEGEVIVFSPRVTKIQDVVTGSVTTIRNRDITKVTVFTNRLIIDVPLEYGATLEQTDALFARVCERAVELPDVEAITYGGVQEFADSSIVHRLFVEAPPKLHGPTKRAVNRIVQECVAEAGMAFPFPHMDVTLG